MWVVYTERLPVFESTTASTSFSPTASGARSAASAAALSIQATDTGFLMQMLTLSLKLSESICQYEWRILEAPPTSGFITCDDALVTVPPSNCPQDGVGIARPGSITYSLLTWRF